MSRFGAVIKTDGLAFTGEHLTGIALALACALLPIASGWTGPLTWRVAMTMFVPFVVTLWALLQKSPKDLAAELAQELQSIKFAEVAVKEPLITVVEIHPPEKADKK